MKFTKKVVSFAVAAALVMPVLTGALTGCNNETESTDDGRLGYYGLDEVTLNDDYAVNALEKEYEYLMKLDEDKLLYWFQKNANVTTIASAGYGGGWESSLIGGHTMGHYLSALAQASANEGLTQSQRAEILEKTEYIIDALKECQDNTQGEDGFLWGAYYKASSAGKKGVEFQFDNVEAGLSNISTEAWVPWYTMHKILQGLIDVYTYTGNETAYKVAVNLGDWVYNRVSKWSEATKNTVLSIEYGGMNDCLYNLYAITGEDKYAVAAHQFDEESLFENILGGSSNYLNNLHANTTIPKIIGALNRYIVCDGKKIDGKTVDAGEMLEVAELFWERVVEHHTYVTGGNSEWEHFGLDDVLDAERTNCNCETCNTYNMLKLSRMLFTITKNVKYLDYYEGTYYNAIWSSQNPETGMTTYFQPMATGYFKVYSTEEKSFWCCTGSGMESMTKLNDSIYYSAEEGVYVSLYLESELKTDSLDLKQTADLENSDEVSFQVVSGSTTLYLRVPEWTDVFNVKIDGKDASVAEENGFAAVSVKKGNTVSVTMEKKVTAYNLPDGENTYAFKYGPFALSAELGTNYIAQTTTGVSVSIPATKNLGDLESEYIDVTNGTVADFIANINDYMVNNGDGTFTLKGIDQTLTYSYHFRQYTQRYGLYFYFTGSDVTVEDKSTYQYEKIDTVQPGYGQYENDDWHEMSDQDSVGSTNDTVAGGTSRYAKEGGSFAYDMAVDKSVKNYLVVYFCAADAGKSIYITADGVEIYSKTLAYTADELYEVLIPIPDSVVANASSKTVDGETRTVINVKFSGVDGAQSARLGKFIYTAAVTFNANLSFSGTRDSSLAYFVDCGDYDTGTISDGDEYGMYNSLTEQIFGIDYATGKYWGLVDGSDPTSGTAGSACSAGGLSSANTWPYEFNNGDGLDKTASNRYTKNQYENGKERYLCYLFELEDGVYEIEVYFSDPWGCSKNVCVSANGEEVISNAACGTAVKARVVVEGGFLKLEFTTTDLCINVCYIKIAFAN